MSSPKSITVTLRWPPSETMYWTRVRHGNHIARIISDDGRAFRGSVALLFKLCGKPVKFHGQVALDIELRRGDALRPDVVGIADPVIDALTHAGIWRGDSQVDAMTVRRGQKVVGESRAVVTITEIEAAAS